MTRACYIHNTDGVRDKSIGKDFRRAVARLGYLAPACAAVAFTVGEPFLALCAGTAALGFAVDGTMSFIEGLAKLDAEEQEPSVTEAPTPDQPSPPEP